MRNTITLKLKKIVNEAQINGYSDAVTRLLLKEFLQNIVLSYIYSDGDSKGLIFYGGTCLRKLYGLDRFSEDLDFESREKLNVDALGVYLEKEFRNEGIEVSCKKQESEMVSRITLKFPILYDLGLSTNNEENLHLKVEINFDVKEEYNTEKIPYSMDQYSCVISHYSLEVLMAGKMIACLRRNYKKGLNTMVKGRDFYDLIWYMGKNIIPDEKKLKDEGYTFESIFKELDIKVGSIGKGDLEEDLLNYFSNTQYIMDWCDNFYDIYESSKKRFLNRVGLVHEKNIVVK